MKLKKGSAAAKAYMAKIRGMKKTAKPAKKAVAGYVKTVRKGSATSVLYTNSSRKAPSEKPTQGKLFGTHKDTRSHNVNIRVVSGTEIITLNQIGAQLNSYEFDIVQMQGEKRHAKLATEKKRLADMITTRKMQFKALKAYLNTRARFR